MSWPEAQESCKSKSMVLSTVTLSNQKEFTKSGWTEKDSDYRNWAPGQPTHDDCGFFSFHTNRWHSSHCSDLLPFICSVDNNGFISNPAEPNPNLVLVNENGPVINANLVVLVNETNPVTNPDPNPNMVLVKENKTWEEALEHCRAIGVDSSQPNRRYRDHKYDLVSLQSEDDHRYARDRIQEATTNEV